MLIRIDQDRFSAEHGRRWAVPAVLFVVIYVALLLLIPSQLIVRPIGAPGTPANLWGMCALLWWVCGTLGGANPVRGLTPSRIAVGLLTLAVMTAYVNGALSGWYAPSAIHQVTDEVYNLVPVSPTDLTARMISAADRGLLSFAGWAGIFLLTADGLRSWADVELLITWLTRLGAVVALLGIVQYFTGLDIAGLFQIPGLSANSDFGAVDTRSILNRVSATAVHPIEFGVVMAGLFPLALNRSLDRRLISSWLPTLLVGMAIPMSVSRSAILTVMIASVILFAGWPGRWRRRALIVAPVAAVALRLMVPGLLGTIRSLFTNLGNDPSISGRTSDYAIVLGLYAQHPWFGRGLFTFVPRYYRVLDNQLLMTLIELGLFGLVALLVVLASGYYSTRRARSHSSDERAKLQCLAVSASIAGVATSYVTFDAWSFPMVVGLTFLLLGIAGAVYRLAGVRSREPHAVTTQLTEPGWAKDSQSS